MSLPPFASRKLTCPSPVPATIHDCICATDRIPPPVDVAVASEEEEEEARGAHRHDAPSVPTSASANRRRPSAVPITIEDDDDVAERHVKPTTRAVDNGGLSLVVSKETRRESAPSRFADGDASSNDGDRENRSPTAPRARARRRRGRIRRRSEPPAARRWRHRHRHRRRRISRRDARARDAVVPRLPHPRQLASGVRAPDVRVPAVVARRRAVISAVLYKRTSGWSCKASVGVERHRARGLKATGGRRDAPGKVLKDRRSPRRRGRVGTSV